MADRPFGIPEPKIVFACVFREYDPCEGTPVRFGALSELGRNPLEVPNVELYRN